MPTFVELDKLGLVGSILLLSSQVLHMRIYSVTIYI